MVADYLYVLLHVSTYKTVNVNVNVGMERLGCQIL
jgi:hypothetical protein